MRCTWRAAGLAGLLILSSCRPDPPYYPIPEQQRPLTFNEATGLLPFIEMNAPEAPEHFVADISPVLEAGTWRWTGERPTLRLGASHIQRPKLLMDLAVPEVTFRDTGPVTVTIYINDQFFKRVRYTTPGNKHFEAPVPRQLLEVAEETTLRMVVHPPWVAPTDGNRLGVILIRAGFVEQ